MLLPFRSIKSWNSLSVHYVRNLLPCSNGRDSQIINVLCGRLILMNCDHQTRPFYVLGQPVYTILHVINHDIQTAIEPLTP